MTFELPPLPYEMNALEPHIGADTLGVHYGKHHQAYVTNLNNLTADTPWATKSLEEVAKGAEGAIFNNAAQVWNHTFYWDSMSPEGGGAPEGKLADGIEAAFGGFDEFTKKFNQAAITQFGSGWAWLVQKDDGTLAVTNGPNASNPLTDGLKPLLTCDVWEHAYYLNYQNRRPDYVSAWWQVVDWESVAKRL